MLNPMMLDVAIGPIIAIIGFALLVVAAFITVIIVFAVKKIKKIKKEEETNVVG